MLSHARHRRFRREKKSLFPERTIRILLRQNLKLCLRIREILVSIVNLRQFHSNLRRERRSAVLLEKALRNVDDLGLIRIG